MVIIGSPEDNTTAGASGSLQAFFNPAWTELASYPVLSPLFAMDTTNTLSILEDGGSIAYDFNASHPFEEDLSWQIIPTESAIGTVTIDNSSGYFSFSPGPNEYGNENFTVRVSTSNSSSDHSMVVSVSSVNDPPLFLYENESTVVIGEGMVGEPMEFQLDLYDEEDDIQDLVITTKAGSILPAGLSIQPNDPPASGFRLTGTPSTTPSGGQDFQVHNFTLLCTDQDGGEDEQDFSILIYKANSPPLFYWNGSVTSSIELSLQEDFTTNQWLDEISNLSFSDIDEDEFTLTVTQNPDPGLGVIEINYADSIEDNEIIFVPNENANGNTSFTIKATDNNLVPKFSEVTIHLSIESVMDSPVIASSPNTEAMEGELYLHNFDIFDPDDEGVLSIELYGVPSWMVVSDDNLSISGTPTWNDYNEGAPFILFLKVTDLQGNTTEQSYPISVIPYNYPPVITTEVQAVFVIDEDEETVAWTPLTLSAVDPDPEMSDNLLSWSIESPPLAGTIAQTTGNGPNFEIIYTPDGNFSGVDFFTVKVEDSNTSDTINIIVQVNPIEDLPVFSSFPQYRTAIKDYSWQYEIVATDGDQEQEISITSTDQLPPWLSLISLSEGRSLLQGTPPAGQDGEYPITLKVEDSMGNQSYQEFTLLVLATNTIPILSLPESNQVSIQEDELWTELSLSINDPDGQKIFWMIDELPSYGTAAFSSSIGTTVDLTYKPDGNYSGTDSFSIQVTDGISSVSSSFSITISEVDDPPVFYQFPQFQNITDDDNLSISFSVQDGDGLEGLELHHSGKPSWMMIDDSLIEINGSIYISGSPTHEDQGSVNLELNLVDSESLTDTRIASFEVYVYNQPPQFTVNSASGDAIEDGNETWAEIGITVSDDQTPSELLIWGIAELPENGTASIEADGTNLTYIPNPNFHGTDIIILSVTDQGGDNSSLPKTSNIDFIVNVENVPDEPAFVSIPPSDKEGYYSWNDESSYTYLIEAIDPDGTDPQITLESRLPSWLSFEELGSGKAMLQGNAKVGDEGTYSIKFSATDGILSDEQSFDLLIRIDDYPPQFITEGNGRTIEKVRIFLDEDEAISENENLPKHYLAINPDPTTTDEISWGIAKSPMSDGNLEVAGEGPRPSVLNYSPPQDFNGYDEFFLLASDGRRTSELKFEIFIRPVPDGPIINTPEQTKFNLDVGEYFEITLSAEDQDSESLSFKLFTPPWENDSWLSIKPGPTSKSITLFGDARLNKHSNTIPVSVSVSDESGQYDAINFVFSINGNNENPSILAGQEITMYFSEEGELLSFNLDELLAFDPEGDLIQWELSPEKTPLKGIVNIEQSAGILTKLEYVPSSNHILEDEFALRATDGLSYDEVTINVRIIKDTSIPEIEGIDLSQIEQVEQGEYFAADFRIVMEGEDYEITFTEKPDWISVQKMEQSTFRISGKSPADEVLSNKIEFYVTSSGRKSDLFSFTVEAINSTPPVINLLGDRVISRRIDTAYTEESFFPTANWEKT